jgi:hypothetical protein
VLKFNLGLTSVVLIVIFAALYAGGQPIGTWPQVFFYQLLIQFTIVTLIFWAMGKHFTQFPDRWDPRKPYGLRHPAFTISEDGPRIPRIKSASQLVALFVALFWLHAVQHSQFLIFGPAAAFLRLSPFWNQLYLPINALLFLGILSSAISLLRPDWVRFHWFMRILGSVGNLLVGFFLIMRGNPVVMTNLDGTADPARVAKIVNQAIYYTILFACLILLVQLVKDVRRLLASDPVHTPARASSSH